LTLLPSGADATDYHYLDVELTGLHKDKTIECWGNISVPIGGSLTLKNVTLIFHTTENTTLGLIGSSGSIIEIVDGDGDHRTYTDASNLSSTNGPWFIIVDNGDRFTIRNSMLTDLALIFNDTDGRTIYGSEVEADHIRFTNAMVELAHRRLTLKSDHMTLFASSINKGDFTDLYLVGKDIQLRDNHLEVPVIINDAQMVNLRGNTHVSGWVIAQQVSDLHVSDSLFIACGVQGYTDVESASFVNCSFRSSSSFAIYIRWADVLVQDCTFDSFSGGVNHYMGNLSIIDSTFDRVDNGISAIAGRISITGCSFTDSRTCVDISSLNANISISDVSIVRCNIGLYIHGSSSDVTVVNSTFTDVWNNAIDFEGIGSLRVESSTFLNLTYGIKGWVDQDYGEGTWVTDCTFDRFMYGIDLTGGGLRVFNVTLVGGTKAPYSATAIRMINLYSEGHVPLVLRNTKITNAWYGILAWSNTRRLIDVWINDAQLARTTDAMYFDHVRGLSLYNVSITDFVRGFEANNTESVSLFDIRLTDGVHGLALFNCDGVRLEDLFMEDISGKAIDESYITYANWTISRPTSLADLWIAVVSDITVTANLTMSDVVLDIRQTPYDGQGVLVTNGASIDIRNSTLRGEPIQPFYFLMKGGGNATIIDTTFVDCGANHVDLAKWGMMLDEGNHTLTRVTTTRCRTGLVLWNSSATLRDCQLAGERSSLQSINSSVDVEGGRFNGSLVGINIEGGDLTAIGTDLDGSVISIRAKYANLTAENVTVTAIVRSIDLTLTNFTMYNGSIGSEGNLFQLHSSSIEVHSVQIKPLRSPGGLVHGSRVVLYDTHHEGTWNVRGSGGEVRFYWHHEISAQFRWNGEPAIGARVSIYDNNDPVSTYMDDVIGPDGAVPSKWFLERMIDPFVESVLAPFHIIIETPGTMGEAIVPGTQPWEGNIVLVDISPPSLEIRSPSPGELFNGTSVMLAGVVSELGSGLTSLDASIDGGFWEPINVTEDLWTILLEVFDGVHNISVRAVDVDGNNVTVNTWVWVDTVGPLIYFTDPDPLTPFTNRQIMLTGLVIFDDGTDIVRCHVAGVPVQLSATGTFRLNTSLPLEGTNEFVVQAWDAVGNRGEARLEIIRDTGAPVITLDSVPPLTNMSMVLLNGSIQDLTAVEVSLEGRYVPVADDGSFVLNLSLSLGSNTWKFEAVDAVGNHWTRDIVVEMDNLINGTIVSPINGAMVEPVVQVEISTDPNTWVRVVDHSEWILSRPNGTVVTFLELVAGQTYTLLVEFRDLANNTLVRGVEVTVVKEEVEEPGGMMPPWVWVALALGCAAAVVAIVLKRYRRRIGPPTD
jgi:hypothetical protein